MSACTHTHTRTHTHTHTPHDARHTTHIIRYGGGDTPAPCGQHSPDNYAFFFSEGASDGAMFNNTFVMGCNGWGTQSHASIIIEGNNFTSVGKSGVEGSGFSSASTVPRATQVRKHPPVNLPLH
jgi:hypothetical protein